MTRRLSIAQKGLKGTSAMPGMPDQSAFGSEEPIHPDPQDQWLRGIVYFSTAIGLALAALMILHPPRTSKDLRALPSPCSPPCR